MRLEAEFIPLPYAFDAARMAEEIAQFEAQPWMDHPDNTEGNAAIALISAGGGDNNGFRGEMTPTPHLARCPYLQQVIASFGEVFGRSRLMRLEPGCEVKAHVDYHYHWHHHVRIHVPIVTSPEVIFHCGDASVNMRAGEAWIFDSWRRHRVVNGGTRARVHLVIDTTGSSHFWHTIERSLAAVRAGAPLAPMRVPWEPGRTVEIATERYNLQPVLAPGEVEYLTRDLIADFDKVPENDPAAIALYRQTLLDFCRDWRALWHRFGIHQPGWPHYARLVASTARALPDLDPPLVLENRTGLAKAAFAARVLNVAVSREIYADFIGLPPGAGPRLAGPGAVPAAAPAPPVTSDEAGRNARCPCGSGKRFKHCHGAGTPLG